MDFSVVDNSPSSPYFEWFNPKYLPRLNFVQQIYCWNKLFKLTNEYDPKLVCIPVDW